MITESVEPQGSVLEPDASLAPQKLRFLLRVHEASEQGGRYIGLDRRGTPVSTNTKSEIDESKGYLSKGENGWTAHADGGAAKFWESVANHLNRHRDEHHEYDDHGFRHRTRRGPSKGWRDPFLGVAIRFNEVDSWLDYYYRDHNLFLIPWDSYPLAWRFT